MRLTRNAFIYGLIGFVSSLVFFYLLDDAVGDKAWGRIWVVAGIYGLVWAVAGLTLSRSDSARAFGGNLGLAYHASGAIATLIAAAIALVQWDTFSVSDFGWVTFGMVLSLLMHWLATRNAPKGIDRKEAFK
jgi:hypothetical protein